MAISFKSRVVLQYLIPAVVIYTALGVFLIKGSVPTAAAILPYVGGASGLAVIATLLQDVIPKPVKEVVIFWAIRDRLPGHVASSKFAHNKTRIDASKISNIKDLCVLGPADQQRIFYAIYRRHEKDIRIQHYSFRYLAWRDTTVILIILGLVTTPALSLIPSSISFKPIIELSVATLAVGILTSFAARLAAHELVYQVLTSETQGKKHAIK